MPRTPMTIAALVAIVLALGACAAPAGGADATLTATEAANPTNPAMPTDPPAPQPPTAGTDLDACEIVAAADIAAVLEIGAAEVDSGDLRESPTSLSPGRTECKYRGDWGGLVVSLTPEDGANLYRAARGSYADASDLEIEGAESAFWSASNKRGFFWKGSVAVMLQVTHLTGGQDVASVTTALGQAAMNRVD
jgi:hypothetical protein